MADKIKNIIITAIDATIGPIAFSTRAENRNERANTALMLTDAAPYAKKNRHNISLEASIRILDLITISSPVPNSVMLTIKLTKANQTSRRKV